MDLGNIIGTLAGGYRDIQIAKASNATIPPQFRGPVTQAFLPTWSDAVEYFTDPVTGETVAARKAECKPKRRRRRRLATKSDLSDLAALKGILGSGEAFKVWIATHGK